MNTDFSIIGFLKVINEKDKIIAEKEALIIERDEVVKMLTTELNKLKLKK